MDLNVKMDNVKLNAEQSVDFLGVMFDHKFLRILLEIQLITPNTLHQIIILLEVNNIGYQIKP